METLWQSLGARPPREITQEAFDFDRGHLIRLTELRPGERPQARDLWDYTQDLRHAREIQTLLLIYVLPFCLHAWREDLCGVSDEYGGFVEHFYPALADRKIFESQLNSKQTTAVSEFMRRTILEEIDNQRGLSFSGAKARPYRWVRALTTYGV